MSIRVLDPLVAQQVAAGEVVERPASVVKELLENALDAGASRIEIELGGGGTSRTLVRDDGSGMSREDATLSVLRHATSKIGSVEDLESVRTLGFRGEALPSIASVSSFSLSTATGEGAGTKVTVEGGAVPQVHATSHPKGTTVVVDRLFYNVPARRAFLKGARSERAAITEVVTHLAVSHPQVAFKLSEEGAGREEEQEEQGASCSHCPRRRTSASVWRGSTVWARRARSGGSTTSTVRFGSRATRHCPASLTRAVRHARMSPSTAGGLQPRASTAVSTTPTEGR